MYNYNAIVLRVVDGDTLDLEVDLGFRTFQRIRVRLHGIDTPETYGVKKGSPEWQTGMDAKNFVMGWLEQHTIDKGYHPWRMLPISITSHDAKPLGVGKYGRWLAVVHAISGDDKLTTLNDALVDAGHAQRVSY